MKTKTFVLLLMLCLGQAARPQGIPVYDNTSFIALAKSLIESAKQTSQLLKTVNFLKEQKERVEKVNSAIKQLNAVREITRNNQKLYTMVQKDLREILNSPYIQPQEITRVSQAFNSIIISSVEDLNFMQQLLTSKFLNMTDAERLELLEAQKMRSREMVVEISQKKKRYHNIISFREAQHKLNNRTVKY